MPLNAVSLRRDAFRTLLCFHLIGLALIFGTRFANLVVEHETDHGTLQTLAFGRDLMGVLARSLTLPGFLLTLATGVAMVLLRYGRRPPPWIWIKIGLTAVALGLASPLVAPALEAARKWAHWSVAHGQLAPQLHDSVGRASLFGAMVFTVILLNIPVAIWKPSRLRKPPRSA
jgi:hypothetical protein